MKNGREMEASNCDDLIFLFENLLHQEFLSRSANYYLHSG